MRRHYLIASLVAANLSASLLAAAERVTFVLTTGERLSGTVGIPHRRTDQYPGR